MSNSVYIYQADIKYKTEQIQNCSVFIILKKKKYIIVNCQAKINKNFHIKLSNYSQLKIIYLSTGFYLELFFQR